MQNNGEKLIGTQPHKIFSHALSRRTAHAKQGIEQADWCTAMLDIEPCSNHMRSACRAMGKGDWCTALQDIEPCIKQPHNADTAGERVN